MIGPVGLQHHCRSESSAFLQSHEDNCLPTPHEGSMHLRTHESLVRLRMDAYCRSLNENVSHRPTRSGTVRRCDVLEGGSSFIRVEVVMLSLHSTRNPN